MAGASSRSTTPVVPNSVNDIEHIESQSIVNYGIIKIFFQPTVNINAALAQVNGMSQTVLKQMPPGITPPLILSFNASSVPILAACALKRPDVRNPDIRFGAELYPPGAGSGSRRAAAASLRRQRCGRSRPTSISRRCINMGVSANDVINALSLQNLITPVGTQRKSAATNYTVNLNDSPKAVEAFNDLPIKTVNGTVIYMRDVAYVHDGSPPQTNAVHVNGASACC